MFRKGKVSVLFLLFNILKEKILIIGEKIVTLHHKRLQ